MLRGLQVQLNERGLRTGYIAGGYHIPIGTSKLIPLTKPVEKLSIEPIGKISRERTERPISLIRLAFIRTAAENDGECPFCMKFPNHSWDIFETDRGPMKLLVCGGCNEKLKPHPSQVIRPERRL